MAMPLDVTKKRGAMTCFMCDDSYSIVRDSFLYSLTTLACVASIHNPQQQRQTTTNTMPCHNTYHRPEQQQPGDWSTELSLYGRHENRTK